MLTKIKGLLNRTNKGTYLALLFMIVFIFSGDVAFAEDGLSGSDVMNILLAIIAVIVGFFSQLIGFLIGADFTSGAIFGADFQKVLKDLWVLVSNVVYFVFAFILVWIAFMNIIGKEGAEYELKQSLPKFIIGVLIVPFSWFAVNFIISISAILTVSVIGLATDTIKGVQSTDAIFNGKDVCSTIKIDATAISAKVKAGKADATQADKDAAKGGLFSCKTTTKVDDLLNGETIGGIMAIYTYGVMKLDMTDKVYSKDIVLGVASVTDIFLKLGVDFIFLIIYGLLIIAITIALFIRGIYIWLFMILSPIFGLFYFFGSEKGGDFSKKFNFKEFINLAMVPVYVAAALSFGLMFIFITAGSMNGDANPILSSIAGGGLKDINTGVEVKGAFAGFGGTMSDSTALFDFIGGVTGKIFINIIALVVLWMAVMAAIRSSDITGAAIQPIADFGKSMGDLMQNAPKYVPILPGGMSMEGIKRVGTMPEQAMQTKVSNKVTPYQNAINKSFGTETISDKDLTDVKNMMKDGLDTNELVKVQKIYKDSVEKLGRNNPQVQKLEKDILTNMKENAITKGSLRTQGIHYDITDNQNEVKNFHALGGFKQSEGTRAQALFNGKSAGTYQNDSSTASKTIKGDYKTDTMIQADIDTIKTDVSKYTNDNSSKIIVKKASSSENIIEVIDESEKTQHTLKIKNLNSANITEIGNLTNEDQNELKAFVGKILTGDTKERKRVLTKIFTDAGFTGKETLIDELITYSEGTTK